MSKVFKKLKLNELQKENLSSREMQKLAGGSFYGCNCASACSSQGDSNSYQMGVAMGVYLYGG